MLLVPLFCLFIFLQGCLGKHDAVLQKRKYRISEKTAPGLNASFLHVFSAHLSIEQSNPLKSVSSSS